jgi:hypothetical protein
MFDRTGTLPGGLPVWRAWWLLRRQRFRSGARHATSAGEPAASGVLVTPTRHAALHSLVHEAARRVGVEPPRAITLGGAARVGMRGHLLTVGLPLVWGLSADQLRVVVAHELALPPTRHRSLVRSMLAARHVVADRIARQEDLDQPHRDNDVRFLAATQALAAAAEHTRDAAAIDAIGGGLGAVEDAALAIFRAEAVRAGFEFFAGTEGVHDLGGQTVWVADVHEGWLLLLRHVGAPGTGWHRCTPLERIPRDHPGLAAELRDVADGYVNGLDDGYVDGLDPAAVPVDGLSDTDQRRLAEQATDGTADRWSMFAELPVEVYRGEVEKRARRHVEAVEALLGGPPADRDELVDVLLWRSAEVRKAEFSLNGLDPANDDPANDDPDVNPLTGVAMLADIIEYTMIKMGWKRDHPAVRRRLAGPDGSTANLDELLDRPDDLRRLLGAVSVAQPNRPWT